MRVRRHIGAFVFLAPAWVLLASTAMAADAPPNATQVYVRKNTWPETMVATRCALEAYRTQVPFRSVTSPLMRGNQPAQRIAVEVEGLELLCLVASPGGDGNSFDQAIWGEATLIARDGTATPLSALEPLSAKVGWGQLLQNINHGGRPLDIAGRVLEHGLWAHAPSELRYALGGQYVRFESWVGIDSTAGRNGSVAFRVHDGRDLVQDLWTRIQHDFPEESDLMQQGVPQGTPLNWFDKGATTAMEKRMIRRALREAGASGEALRHELKALSDGETPPSDPRWLTLYLEGAQCCRRVKSLRSQSARMDLDALRRAIEDLSATFPTQYRHGAAWMKELKAFERDMPQIRKAAEQGDESVLPRLQELVDFQREVLQANPLLDFGRLLLVRRNAKSPALGLPANWQGNCSLPRAAFDDAIVTLSPLGTKGRLEPLFHANGKGFILDVDLNFHADRMLFSMRGRHNRWQIWEVGTDGSDPRQVTPGDERDVDNYDACYLPDGRIIYGSTACYLGIPCVFGSSAVANLCIMDAEGRNIRQLCFDQDHNWCPVVLNSGRVLYQRWEYADIPHSNTRLLFHMNPDGTGQMEYYGSNSYWPNSLFFARPIPNHPTQVVGIATGHHGVRRMGELLILDPALGRHEANGVVQRIPGFGQKVEALIRDQLVNESWPKFLHPYPLSGKYFLVSCQPSPDALWGIYLVDVFDNILLLREQPGYALFEPIPFCKTPRPPIIPDKVRLDQPEALVYLADVYQGTGLKGIPPGTVKQLRVTSYAFSYRGMGGLLGIVGMDGPWDVKRILGTVPVEEDGSALFRVPANTPVAVHPLDVEGKALQSMRSWFTAMPGEVLSCVGCHEPQNTPPPLRANLAARRAPSEIKPWYGPPRGFSFAREVQPVLDRYCIGCHNGQSGAQGVPPDLRGEQLITDWNSGIAGHADPAIGGKFSVSYAALHRYVRRPGIESDYHLLAPMEFHADTTELVQILAKGHHGVALDREAWDRLVTWIDLNAPYHGTWTEAVGEERVTRVAARKRELLKKYAGLDVDFEAVYAAADLGEPVDSALPGPAAQATHPPAHAVDPEKKLVFRSVDLGGGISLELARIPAGVFTMGRADGPPDEAPPAEVQLAEPFWMGRTEITNEQYARFDPSHDSGVESKHGYQFGIHGVPLNGPRQPVVRVSWEQALAFCRWLSAACSEPFGLPTEAQWEYACRAPGYVAAEEGDYSKVANLADETLAQFASNPYTVSEPIPNPNRYDDWIPRDNRFCDGGLVTRNAASYLPNGWGLHDMLGNVWEWTLSAHKPYPYEEQDGRNALAPSGRKVVRGGSWYDRPQRASATYRVSYAPWQPVFNVGFRVVCPARRDALAKEW